MGSRTSPGCAVLLSSHELDEVQRICDPVATIRAWLFERRDLAG